jgi:hypothetical protein
MNPFLFLRNTTCSDGSLHPGWGYPKYISAIPPGFIPNENPLVLNEKKEEKKNGN